MTFYGYILVSIFNFANLFFYERRAFYSAGIFVGASQLLWLILSLAALKKFFGIDWIDTMFRSGLFAVVMVSWIVGISLYYKLSRVEALQKELEEKPKAQRIMWGIIAILSAAVPAGLLAILSPVVK
jgi:hypothetical protein